MINIAVDDKSAVLREEQCKTVKRVADVLNIFKEIQMVFFYIENNADFG